MALSDTVSFFQYASCVALPYGCQYHAQYGDIEIMGIFTYGDKVYHIYGCFFVMLFFSCFCLAQFHESAVQGRNVIETESESFI